jgi:hypothetical protein
VWSFTERVGLFLELADEIDGLRMSRTGIDLSSTFHWATGEAMTGSIARVDVDDFRSFIAAWRQLVMRQEPTHLVTLLSLCSSHLTLPKLRELAALVAAHVDVVNRGGEPGGFRLSIAAGEHEYTPWEVADLVMHGSVFHRKDRAKRKILEDLQALGMLPTIDFIFRKYVIDTVEAMDSTRLLLLKAREWDALSDAAVDAAPT